MFDIGVNSTIQAKPPQRSPQSAVLLRVHTLVETSVEGEHLEYTGEYSITF